MLKFWSMILRDKSYIKNQIFGGEILYSIRLGQALEFGIWD